MNASNPRRSALLGMGVSSALHFSAYELSRSAILTFFTSSASHFSWNHGALSFATGCIGPVSVVFLWVCVFLLQKLWNKSAFEAPFFGSLGEKRQMSLR
jgi:hypothetical protein